MMNDDLASLKTRYEPKQAAVLKLDRQLNAARFTSCGRFLLAAGHDGLVRRFDCGTDEMTELKSLTGHSGWVQRVVTSPPGGDTEGRVYSADSWGGLQCRSFSDEAEAPRWFHPQAHHGWILDLVRNAGGNLIATCGIDRKIRIWSAVDGTKQSEFENPDWEVLCLAFGPDGASVVTGDLAGMIRHWDVASGKVLRQFDASALHKSDRLQEVGGVRRLLFSPDGKFLVCAGTKPKVGGNVQGIPTVTVFQWDSGQADKTFELGKEGDVYVTDLEFHPEGFLMATISGNPGAGKLVFRRLEDEVPFFETTSMPNCHSLTLHPDRVRLAVVATNGGSNGNGRSLDKNGAYPSNFSPIHIWKFPADQSS